MSEFLLCFGHRIPVDTGSSLRLRLDAVPRLFVRGSEKRRRDIVRKSERVREQIVQSRVYWVGLMDGFYFLVLVGEQKMATKWYYLWFPGLILGSFCTFFEPDPSGGVLEPSLANSKAVQ